VDQIEANLNVSGAKGTLALSGITYLVDPVGDSIWGTFAKWARAQIKATPAKKATPILNLVSDPGWASLSPEIQAIMAKTVAANMPTEAPKPKTATDAAAEAAAEYQSVLMTDEGVAFMAWLLIRPNHPEATLAEITKGVKEVGFEQVTIDLQEAGSFEAYQKKAEAKRKQTP
jgi:hypothetical protein